MEKYLPFPMIYVDWRLTVMLGQIDVNKSMQKKEYDAKMDQLEVRFGELQRACKEKQIPVMVVFEGLDAAGKGTMINRMIQSLDPRGFKVFTVGRDKEDEVMRPYFWRYFTKTPEKGRMHIFDQSWYKGVYEQIISEKEVLDFEEMLTEDGCLIIKFFLMISKQEQKKRLEKLEKNHETSWRVTEKDKVNNKNYEKCLKEYDRVLVHTDTAKAPWTVVEATDKQYATCKIITTMVERMERAVREVEESLSIEADKKGAGDHGAMPDVERFRNGVLQGIDLSKTMEQEEYKKKKKELQKRLLALHNKMYLKRVPVILAFEGWDAGGKGGAIKRLTEKMDPRGYVVHPTASPNDIERQHHYLWRFWTDMPKAGHVTIFDRTWYGRVMVERIEGFCTEQEWKRAYKEINSMERDLADAGAVVLKFWMQIDKDEQERRFKARQENPEKQWKITDEDWRNREKWDQYEEAVNEMLIRTSTPYAPWVVVEGNSKYYARIKVLETVVKTIEERLKKD